LGDLPGVATVAYDCKVATVTMKEGGTMTKEAATEALAKNNFKLSSFEGGPAPTVAAYLFRVAGMPAVERETVEKRLRGILPEAREVAVDSAGIALVAMREGSETTEKALADALMQEDYVIESFETKDWPAAFVTYEAALEGPAGAEVRGIVRGVDKVIAVQVFGESRTVRLRLKEPCDKIEEKVRGALADQGCALVRFESKS